MADVLDLAETPDAVRRLMAFDGRAAIRTLHLEDCGLDAAAVTRIAELPELRGVQRCFLAGNLLDPSAVEVLAGSALFQDLQVLDLRFNPLGDAGVAALADANLETLEELYLADAEVGDVGVTALAAASLPRLRVLGLGDHTTEQPAWDFSGLDHQPTDFELGRLISAVAVSALARSPLVALRELDLCTTALYDVGIEALLAAPWVTALTHLYLRDCGCSAEKAAALRNHPRLSGIEVLEV